MTKLPIVSGREVAKALSRAGFKIHHQKGSHIVMVRMHPPARVVVPNHPMVKRGTLKDIISDAGLTVEEFNNLL